MALKVIAVMIAKQSINLLYFIIDLIHSYNLIKESRTANPIGADIIKSGPMIDPVPE
jgi:hypothetical protein